MMMFLKDFYGFLRTRKRLVLVPLILLLLLFGSLVFFAGSGSVLAPFIYTLF